MWRVSWLVGLVLLAPGGALGEARGGSSVLVVRSGVGAESFAERLSAPLRAELRRSGLALRGIEPPAEAPPVAPLLAEASEAYANLDPERARATAERLLDELERRGALGATREQVIRLFVLLALSSLALGDDEGAAGAIDRMLAVDPAVELDPATHPPNLRALVEARRADATGAADVTLTLRGLPAGVEVFIDGGDVETSASSLSLRPGEHFVAVRADGYHPWGGLVDLRRGPRDVEVELEEDPWAALREPGGPGAETAPLERAAALLGVELLLLDVEVADGRASLRLVEPASSRRGRAEAAVTAPADATAAALVAAFEGSGADDLDDGSAGAAAGARRRRRIAWIVVGSVAAAVAAGVVIGVVAAEPWAAETPTTWEGRLEWPQP